MEKFPLVGPLDWFPWKSPWVYHGLSGIVPLMGQASRGKLGHISGAILVHSIMSKRARSESSENAGSENQTEIDEESSEPWHLLWKEGGLGKGSRRRSITWLGTSSYCVSTSG